MVSPRMLSDLCTMARVLLTSTFFLLLLCTERRGKSRAFLPEVSEKDQEAEQLLTSVCPPTISLARTSGS